MHSIVPSHCAAWFAAALLASVASAQAPDTTFFAPAGYAGTEGESRLSIPFSGAVGRAQFVLGRDAFRGLGSPALFRSLALRPERGARIPKSVDLSVSMSNSFHDFQVDGNMLRHRGPEHAEWFARRVIQLPAVPANAPVPSPARILLTLDRPFQWYGGAVCIEIAIHSATATAYDLDGVLVPGTGYGTVASYGAACPGGRNVLTTSRVPWPDGVPIWTTTVSSTTTQSGVAFLFVGFSNTHFGAANLPLDLDPILGTQGCRLLTDVVFPLPFLLSGQTSTTYLMPRIGYEPDIAGLSLFLQALVADAALPGGLGMSNGLHTHIGIPPVGTSGWASGSPTNTNMDTFLVEALTVEIGL